MAMSDTATLAPVPTPPLAPPLRIAVLDFLRGFAVLGILAINITGFWGPQLASLSPSLPPGDASGSAWFVVSFIVFDGKMRALFTLLFGASMVLFAQSAERRGLPADRLQLRRLLWLAVIGYAHFALLWWGDILFAYALCGMLALPLRRLPASALLAIALPVFVLAHAFAATAALPAIATEARVSAGQGDAADQAQVHEVATRIAASLHEDGRVLHAGFGQALAIRLGETPGFPLTATLNTFSETFPLMLVGMALLRSGALTGAWRRRTIAATGSVALLAGLAATLGLVAWGQQAGWPPQLTFALTTDLAALPRLAMALGYAALLVLAWPYLSGTVIGRAMAAAGRTAFTNYLGTTLVMSALFCGWGLGLGWGGAHAVPRWTLPLFVPAGWALMLAWPQAWLARFGQGPLERGWRRLTFAGVSRT
jgi:uncharacterized protein